MFLSDQVAGFYHLFELLQSKVSKEYVEGRDIIDEETVKLLILKVSDFLLSHKLEIEGSRKRNFKERYEGDEETSKRKEAVRKLEIRRNYSSEEYRGFFISTGQSKITNVEKNIAKIIFSSKTVTRDFELFNQKSHKIPKLLQKLDFYSLLLGFRGWGHANALKYDLAKLEEENRKRSGSNDENSIINAEEPNKSLEFLLDFTEEVKESQKASNDLLSAIWDRISNQNNEESIDRFLVELKDKNRLRAKSDPYGFINEIFEEVVKADKIKETSKLTRLEWFFEDESRWAYRCVLSSALTLSLLENWDLDKFRLLKRLKDSDHALESRRAWIGLAFTIIKNSSSPDVSNVIAKEINFNSGTLELRAAIYSILYVLKSVDLELCLTDYEEYFSLDRKERWQFFEPFHESYSIGELVADDFSVEVNKSDFFYNLNNSCTHVNSIKLDLIVGFNELTKLNEHLKLSLTLRKEDIKEGNYLKKLNTLLIDEVVLLLLVCKDSNQFLDYHSIFRTNVLDLTENGIKKFYDNYPYVGYARFGIQGLVTMKLTDLNGLIYIGEVILDKSENDFSLLTQAQTLFSKALEVRRSAWLLRKIGFCNLKMGGITGDKEFYFKSITYYKDSLRIEEDDYVYALIGRCWFHIIQIEIHEDYLRECISYLTKAEKSRLKRDWVEEQLCFSLYYLGDLLDDNDILSQCLEFVYKFQSQNEFKANHWLLRAEVEFKIGRANDDEIQLKTSIYCFYQYLRKVDIPQDVVFNSIGWAWERVGIILKSAKAYKKSLKYFNEYKEKTGFEDHWILSQMGHCLISIDKCNSSSITKALEYFNKSIDLKETPFALKSKVYIILYGHELSIFTEEYLGQAVDCLRSLIEIEGKGYWVLSKYADVFLRLSITNSEKRYEIQAITLMKEALSYEETSLGYSSLSLAYLFNSRHDQRGVFENLQNAKLYAFKSLDLDRDNGAALINVALYYYCLSCLGKCEENKTLGNIWLKKSKSIGHIKGSNLSVSPEEVFYLQLTLVAADSSVYSGLLKVVEDYLLKKQDGIDSKLLILFTFEKIDSIDESNIEEIKVCIDYVERIKELNITEIKDSMGSILTYLCFLGFKAAVKDTAADTLFFQSRLMGLEIASDEDVDQLSYFSSYFFMRKAYSFSKNFAQKTLLLDPKHKESLDRINLCDQLLTR